MPTSTDSAAVEGRIAQWVAAGLITGEQAEAIRQWEQAGMTSPVAAPRRGVIPTTTPAETRRSLLAEALAYVGGAVIAAAVVLIVGHYWGEMRPFLHYVILVGGALVMLTAGALAPFRTQGGAARRLRGVLWLLSAVLVFGSADLVMYDVTDDSDSAFLATAAVVAAYSLILWLLHRFALQHVAAFAAITMLVAAVILQATDGGAWVGVGWMATGVAWGTLAWLDWLPEAPSTVGGAADGTGTSDVSWNRRVGWVMAVVGLAIGTVIVAAFGDFPWAALVAMAVMLAAAVLVADVPTLAIAGVGTLIGLPLVVQHYVSSTLATALVLLLAGALIVGLGLWVVNRRHRGSAADQAVTEAGRPA